MQAWLGGRTLGLLVAASFAMTLNFAVLASLGLFAGNLQGRSLAILIAVAWTLCLAVWALGLVWARRNPSATSGVDGASADSEADDRFREAQHEYLKGHWIEAETLVSQLLRNRPQDVEARILLAAIQRRTARPEEAKRLLAGLRAGADALAWRLEIDWELERLSLEQTAKQSEREFALDGAGVTARAA
jgi:hypothetical protein